MIYDDNCDDDNIDDVILESFNLNKWKCKGNNIINKDVICIFLFFHSYHH